jgi:glycine cleavage system H protein
VKCPFLEEVVVRYCQAYPVRKMIPCSAEESTCVGDGHFSCSTFKEMAREDLKVKEEMMAKMDSTSQVYPSLKASSNFFPPYWANICRPSNCPACIYRSQCIAAEGKWLKEPVLVSGFVMQRGLHFSRAHTWAKTRKADAVRIGFDDFAQKLLGKITTVELPEKGSALKQGESAWSVKCGSRSADLLSPIDGEVISVNEKLFKDTSMINKDPYGNGWALTLKPYNLEENLRLLYQGDEAKTWLENDADRLHRRVAKDLGVTVADGGQLIEAINKKVPAKEWKKLVEDFLHL